MPDKPKPLSIYDSLELLDRMEASKDDPRSDERFTLEVARALDYHGHIEFRSRMGHWHSPLGTRGSIDGHIKGLWDQNVPIRLSERGRGRLAAFRVPIENDLPDAT